VSVAAEGTHSCRDRLAELTSGTSAEPGTGRLCRLRIELYRFECQVGAVAESLTANQGGNDPPDGQDHHKITRKTRDLWGIFGEFSHPDSGPL